MLGVHYICQISFMSVFGDRENRVRKWLCILFKILLSYVCSTKHFLSHHYFRSLLAKVWLLMLSSM